jgi:drug/metabolite transporter (DMT)-like permease
MAHASPAPRLAYVAWVAVCIIWGTTYLAILIALETIPPTLLGGIRFLVAGLLLLAFARATGISLPPAGTWRKHALIGVLMISAGNGFVVWSEKWIPSGIAAVGVATLPFWMAGLEAGAGRERMNARAVLGLCIGFAGIVLLIWPSLFDDGGSGPLFVLGIVLVQLACLGWALGSSMSKRLTTGGIALSVSAVHQLAGGVGLLAVGTALGEWPHLAFTTRTLVAELYLIAFGSLLAYSAYVYALQHLPITTVSLYAYINPVIAMLLGALVAGEPLTLRVAAAAALVLAGIAIVRTSHAPTHR